MLEPIVTPFWIDLDHDLEPRDLFWYQFRTPTLTRCGDGPAEHFHKSDVDRLARYHIIGIQAGART